MNIWNRQELKALMARQTGPCVSILLPTHRSGASVQEGPIRLKNLLRDAEAKLTERGLRQSEAESMLETAGRLVEDPLFWQHQGNGLAVFVAEGLFRWYRAPLRFQELAIVADRFHVKPMLSLLAEDGHFFILALSQSEVRLFEATRESVTEVHLESLPTSMADALQLDEPEKTLQSRTTGPGGATVFHGHGAGGDEAKDRIMRYFRQIDHGLRDFLRDERAPLVLAGVGYLLPLYREVNSYPQIPVEEIHGNPEEMPPDTLRERAWGIVAPRFAQAKQSAIDQYSRLRGTGLASSEIEVIIPAAVHGRVAVLFVAVGTQHWGVYDADSGALELHQEPLPGDEDLLNAAAMNTLATGGTVFAMQPQEVPGESAAAAVFRY